MVGIRPISPAALLMFGSLTFATQATAQLATFDDPETIGASFELIDQTGAPVSEESFRDRLMLVFFGYTHCPDICPAELSILATALDILGPQSSQIAFLFVSLDPDRDTPELLGHFASMFREDLKALVGTEKQIRSLADAYRVVYAKHEMPDGDYMIDHSSLAYLMDRDGDFSIAFLHGTSAERIATEIKRRL